MKSYSPRQEYPDRPSSFVLADLTRLPATLGATVSVGAMVLLAATLTSTILTGNARSDQPQATPSNSAPQPLTAARDDSPLPSWPLVFSEDFEAGATRWETVDPEGWRIEKQPDGNHVFHQFRAESSYEPKFRSPFHQALVKDLQLTNFVLEARVRSTHQDYNHRDACLFFGHQSPTQFYYVHFGKQTDDHANQIFIVNQQPRTKISDRTTDGTPWTNDWHRVRVVRRTEAGTIEVFFDDMRQAVMHAVDRSFPAGRIGIGSFDDTAAWDDIRVYGEAAP